MATATARENAGFKITGSFRTHTYADGRTEEIVFGERGVSIERDPTPYVTWLCIGGDSYAWGHYFRDKDDAVDDFQKRVARGF